MPNIDASDTTGTHHRLQPCPAFSIRQHDIGRAPEEMNTWPAEAVLETGSASTSVDDDFFRTCQSIRAWQIRVLPRLNIP
jgi:hypothetical protein